MKLFAKLKKKSGADLEPPLNFPIVKVAMNLLLIIFLNFAMSFVLACQLLSSNKKWDSPSSFLRYTRLKTKCSVFFGASFVSMVTYYVTLMSASG